MMKRIQQTALFLVLVHNANLTYADDLTSGYSKLLTLSSSNDISASTLHSEGVDYNKYILPYVFENLYQYEDYAFSLGLKGSYLKVRLDPISINDDNDIYYGRWDIFNVMVTPKVDYKLNQYVTLEGAVDLAYSKMVNNSKVRGSQEVKEGLTDNGLLDWDVNTLHFAPEIGAKFKKAFDNNDELTFHSRISYMVLTGIDNNKSGVKVDDNAGTWSTGASYLVSDALNIMEKDFDLLLSNRIGGFYGKGYRDLSFGFINSTEVAVETPLKIYGYDMKMKIGVGYLSSDNAHGTTLVFGLQ